MDPIDYPTEPVEQIVGAATAAAFASIESGTGCIIKRGSLSQNGSMNAAIAITIPRVLSAPSIEQLKLVLTSPKSYWIGCPIYRRHGPKPGFLFQLESSAGKIQIAVDLQNPGWRIDHGTHSYEAFTFAGQELRAIAKALFPEYASASANATWTKDAFADRADEIR